MYDKTTTRQEKKDRKDEFSSGWWHQQVDDYGPGHVGCTEIGCRRSECCVLVAGRVRFRPDSMCVSRRVHVPPGIGCSILEEDGTIDIRSSPRVGTLYV